jgi:hypothetical protein
MSTNTSLAVFLVDDRARCIKVAYDKQQMYGGKDIGSDIKSFKTLDPTIKKGDFVVIETSTRWGLTVGRVEEVDCLVNYANPEEMRWAIGFDHSTFKLLKEEEQKLIGVVSKAEEQDAREQLRRKMMASNPNFAGLSLIGNDITKAPPERPGSAEMRRGGAQRQDEFTPQDLDENPF